MIDKRSKELDREPLFELGAIGVTPWAAEVLDAAGLHPIDVVARHVTGDWGTYNNDPEQARENAAGVKDGGRILSSYPMKPRRPGTRLRWSAVSVVTFLGHSQTMVFTSPEALAPSPDAPNVARFWTPHELAPDCGPGCGHEPETIAWYMGRMARRGREEG